MKSHLALCIGTIFGLSSFAYASDTINTDQNPVTMAVTNPFYHPTSGGITLTTDTGIRRIHYKEKGGSNATIYHKTIFETMTVGITDQLTVTGSFGNVFDRRSYWNAPTEKKDKNLDFEGGLAYTFPQNDARLLQVGIGYGQRQSLSHEQHGEYKYAHLLVKSGYRMNHITSYISAETEIPIAQNSNAHDEPQYQVKIATNGLFLNNRISTDVALRFNYNAEHSIRAWSADAGFAYLFTPKTALGAKIGYTFKATGADNSDLFDKQIGLFFKIAF